MLMLRNHSQKRIFSVYSDEIMQRQHGLQSEVTDIGELTPPKARGIYDNNGLTLVSEKRFACCMQSFF